MRPGLGCGDRDPAAAATDLLAPATASSRLAWRIRLHRVTLRPDRHGHACRQPCQQCLASADLADAARSDGAPAAVSRAVLLGRQGTDRAELLPVPRGGIRHPLHARRPQQPGEHQGTVRTGVHAAEDHLPRSAAVRGDAASQRPGGGRRHRPGASAAETPRREETPRAAGETLQCVRLSLARDRPRVDPQQALSLHALVLRAAGRDLQRAAGLCRRCC